MLSRPSTTMILARADVALFNLLVAEWAFWDTIIPVELKVYTFLGAYELSN